MQQQFEDTVQFNLKKGLSAEAREQALQAIKRIGGVFALQASTEQGAFDVQMDNPEDSAAIGHQIAQQDTVQTTTITPAAFHALKAKIAGGQQGPSLYQP